MVGGALKIKHHFNGVL